MKVFFGKKWKYHRGTGRQYYWVFGMVERNSRKAVMQLIERRNTDTLLPIISNYASEWSTIFLDMWAAYNSLENEGFTHDTVNHSEEFVSNTGCCTNTIEGLWGLVKLKIKKMKGVLPHRLPFILDEFMHRYRFGHENGDVYYRFLLYIASFCTNQHWRLEN